MHAVQTDPLPLPKTVLVVDDNLNNLRLLCSILDQNGFRVKPARNGKVALNACRLEPPHIILLDINMPGLDGYDVCRELKQDDRTADIPVIFISAYNQASHKVKGFQHGGIDYITKPFQAEEVLARVTTHITIRELRRDLELRSQDLEAFGHAVAHDLKNPLHYIMGLSQIMLEGLEKDAQLYRDIDSIYNASVNMETITNTLLVLAAIRYDDVPLELLDMKEIVDQSVAQVKHRVAYRKATLEIPDQWPVAAGVARWVQQIWINYLTNALKYGGRPPLIALGADEPADDGTVRFWIQDNGKGMTPDQQKKLFVEFSRVGRSDDESLGLGLSVVKRIARKLGGDVGVVSEPGKGSTFWFTLHSDLPHKPDHGLDGPGPESRS